MPEIAARQTVASLALSVYMDLNPRPFRTISPSAFSPRNQANQADRGCNHQAKSLDFQVP